MITSDGFCFQTSGQDPDPDLMHDPVYVTGLKFPHVLAPCNGQSGVEVSAVLYAGKDGKTQQFS